MEVKQGMGGSGDKKVNTGNNWQKILTPVVGLVLLVLGAAVSYLLSDPLTIFLRSKISNFPKQSAVQFAVAFGIFLVLMLILYMVYSLVAAKPKATVTEAAMDKEKKEKLEEQLRVKRRNAEMKQRMKQANRNKKE